MRFKKEIAICLLILLIIVWFDIIFADHFSKQKEEIELLIGKLQEMVINNENLNTKSEDLYKKWFEFESKSSYYIEHDELEKISLKIKLIKKFVDIDENEHTVEYLEEIKFLLDHIYDKDKLRLKNIF